MLRIFCMVHQVILFFIFLSENCLGTGKTTALIEAVIQLTKKNNLNRILVCTPSNTAADHFALTLLKTGEIDKEHIFRVYPSSHNPQEKSKELLELTYLT